MVDSKKFSSKLILFGEYTATLGSSVLAFPYPEYWGQWNNTIAQQINSESLQTWSVYLLRNHAKDYEVEQFITDINNGLFFNSNIPIGYGCGSSGALVAAFYEKYALQKTTKLQELKIELAKLESFFHGNSSGIDPLVSYTNQSLLVDSGGNIDSFEWENFENISFFIVDSFQSRSTEKLVNLFKEKIALNQDFKRATERLSIINQKIIHATVAKDKNDIIQLFREISRLQFDFFQDFIPVKHKESWIIGLETNLFYLKLCGAGGGGFSLGITHDFVQTQKLLLPFEIKKIMVN